MVYEQFDNDTLIILYGIVIDDEDPSARSFLLATVVVAIGAEGSESMDSSICR